VLVGFGGFVVWWLVVGLVCGLFGVLVGVLIYYVFRVKLFVVFEGVWARLGIESLVCRMET
jgi:hypothetical protein